MTTLGISFIVSSPFEYKDIVPRSIKTDLQKHAYFFPRETHLVPFILVLSRKTRRKRHFVLRYNVALVAAIELDCVDNYRRWQVKEVQVPLKGVLLRRIYRKEGKKASKMDFLSPLLENLFRLRVQSTLFFPFFFSQRPTNFYFCILVFGAAINACGSAKRWFTLSSFLLFSLLFLFIWQEMYQIEIFLRSFFLNAYPVIILCSFFFFNAKRTKIKREFRKNNYKCIL